MSSSLMNPGRIILVLAAMLFGAMTEVRGGTITAGQLIAGCGITTTPINPAVLGKSFNSICSMDIVFTVTNNGALGQVAFRETVANISGQTWTDFHMQLGFGFGSQFTPVPGNCGVGFTTVPMPTSGSFNLRGVSSSSIDWGGGRPVPTGTSAVFGFSINVEDLSPCIPVGSRLPNGYVFTLRETPTIPEPTTMFLLGTGLAGIAIKLRKRARS